MQPAAPCPPLPRQRLWPSPTLRNRPVPCGRARTRLPCNALQSLKNIYRRQTVKHKQNQPKIQSTHTQTAIKTIVSAAALVAVAGPALAQGDASAYPNRPVTVVTAFAVGSGPDAVLRIVGEKLAQRWKQGVTVDNRPGGGGFVAIEYARRAKPDGYTLLQLDSEHISALPYLYKNKNFNTLSHFDPVAPLFLTPFFVAVPTNSQWKNMGDLIKSAKAEPGKIS